MPNLHRVICRPPVATASSLESVDVSSYATHVTCVVSGSNTLYEYDKTSIESPDGDRVIQPSSGVGRWIRIASSDIGNVIDNLTSTSATNPLSANQGRVLNVTKIGAVVDDTTPQLGGDLDVNGNSIVSASNGDINITPDGTGKTIISNVEITSGEIVALSPPLSVTSGGTGLASAPSDGQVLVGDSSSYSLAQIEDVANQTVVSSGAGSITVGTVQDISSTSSPSFEAVTLNSSPSADSDAVRKDYVDELVQGFSWKDSVVVSTTGNITLSGEQTIDGVLTSSSRVLVRLQTDQTENGIYVSNAGAWTRSLDANTGEEIVNATVPVIEGDTCANCTFKNTNDSITIGVTNITFTVLASTQTHNSLGGLQGGAPSEYNHITNSELVVLQNTSGTNTGDQDLSGVLSEGNTTGASNVVVSNGQLIGTTTTSSESFSLSAYDVDGASYVDFATLTAGNTPTMSLNGDVTSVTQTPGDNSTKIATTEYVDEATGVGSTLENILANGNETGANNIVVSDSQLIGSDVSAASSYSLAAYDVDGAAYTNFITLTSNNSPTCDLSTLVTRNGNAILDDTSTVSSLTTVGTITAGVWNGTEIDITAGGTGATDASTARTNLGLEIGTDVQAYSSNLDDFSSASNADGNFVVGNGSNFVVESGLNARNSLGLGDISTQDSSNVSISGGLITGIVDLAVADGGTGASTAADARTNLGLEIGADVQAYSSNLDDVSLVSALDGNFIVGNGSNFVGESGNTAATSLGLGSADNVSFSSVTTTADVNVGAALTLSSVTLTAGTYSAVDVSSVGILIIDTSGGIVTVNDLSGGVDGQVLYLYRTGTSTTTMTIVNNSGSNQSIFLRGTANYEPNNKNGGLTLICDGTNWYGAGMDD